MEDYTEKIRIGSINPMILDRLYLKKTDYGYFLFDRVLKVNIIENKSKEICEEGKKLLETSPYHFFEEFLLRIADDEVITNKIIIFREKHGDMIYSIPTLNDLYKVSIHVLKQRIDNGYIQKRNIKLNELGFIESDIKEMPAGIQKAARIELDNYINTLKEYKENNNYYDLVLKSINENNGKLAYKLLKNKINCEYEDFDIVEPIKL